MHKYLTLIISIGLAYGQDDNNKSPAFVNESTFKSPKLYCSECKLLMKETMMRFVCRNNHMSVKKSKVRIDKNGILFINKNGHGKDEYLGGNSGVICIVIVLLAMYMLDSITLGDWFSGPLPTP
tara:strand:+ start:45 stop:416 length:372 start_codon:yes stop_codon:yes gene_type:complete